jgi:hypothetical protein
MNIKIEVVGDGRNTVPDDSWAPAAGAVIPAAPFHLLAKNKLRTGSVLRTL